jgi:hypothetical protein
VVGVTSTHKHQQFIGAPILTLFLLQLVFEPFLLNGRLLLESLELLLKLLCP